ncbi:MAG: FecR family protein [bacterium]
MNLPNKIFRMILLGLVLVFTPFIAYGAGTIVGIEGEAILYHGGGQETTKLNLNDLVNATDVIETKTGTKVKIRFEDSSILSLGENTKLEIKEQVYAEESKFRKFIFKTIIGNVRSLVGKSASKDSTFEVETPTAVMGVRGTTFITKVISPKMTQIIVLEGEVFAKNINISQEITLTKNMSTHIEANQPPETPKILTPQQIQQIQIETELKSEIEQKEEVGKKIGQQKETGSKEAKDDSAILNTPLPAASSLPKLSLPPPPPPPPPPPSQTKAKVKVNIRF